MRTESRPILPIGVVNLLTGECTGPEPMFPTVWNCWPESAKEHNMLVKFASGRQRIVHTSGEGDPVGDVAEFSHDQTGGRYGEGEVIAVEPHTAVGLRKLAVAAGRKRVTMATYK